MKNKFHLFYIKDLTYNKINDIIISRKEEQVWKRLNYIRKT